MLRPAGCYVSLLPCLAAGEVAHHVRGASSIFDCFVPAAGTALAMATCGIPTHCCVLASTRDKMRKQYGIEEVRDCTALGGLAACARLDQ